ncbi:MAG TPA: S8 family serine peptidase [Candidatus Polarisedimenticolaceae bacterium]|nr:S8 family serine peptidase [Candidatus Polarisedimenticolaceae bacterium]
MQKDVRVACNAYLADRLELELTADLAPDATTNMTTLPRPLLRAALQAAGATLEPSVSPALAIKYGLTRLYTVRLPSLPLAVRDQAAEGLLRALKAIPSEVARVARVPVPRAPGFDPFVHERDRVVFPEDCPCGTQWYLHRTNIPEAWKMGANGDGVVVVVVDWGFATEHPELPVHSATKPGALEMTHAFNACAPGSAVVPGPDAAHGVATTGLLGARMDGVGMQGVAFRSRIWPMLASCSGAPGGCDDAAMTWTSGKNPWAEAIVQAIDEPSQERRKVLLLEVQSCCMGNYEASLAVEGAIKRAIDRGIVVVLAAGNGNRDAGCDEAGNVIVRTKAIVVGATVYAKDALDGRSNYGERLDVSAPGDADFDLTLAPPGETCAPGMGYRKSFGGTSGAAAKVAGVAALMLDKCRKLTPEDVRDILVRAGAETQIFRMDRDPANPNDPGTRRRGGSFLNAAKAVKMAEEVCALR